MTQSAAKSLTVKNLFDRDVRSYSVYANYRAIPHVMDGFKTSQRKVIFGTLKKAIPDTGIKVSQLAAAIGQVAAYHHGEASLEGAIVNMAQDFAGSNNLNYLEPNGQFGSRLSPAAASARYIYTRLMPSFRKIFLREDDVILKHLVEDGEEIEPEFYAPILPNVLINGASGMGTGFACNIMQYNPLDLREYIMAKLKGKPTKPLVPWFRGFKGTVERLPTGQVLVKGKVEKVSSTVLKVTEIPIGVTLDQYKNVLNALEDEGYIKEWSDHSNKKVGFQFELTVPRTTGYAELPELEKKLRLISKHTENFTVWLVSNMVKCFKTPEELVDYFIVERTKLVEDRRIIQIELHKDEHEVLSERARFIAYFIEHSQDLVKLARAALEAKLRDEGFKRADEHVELKIYTLTADHIEKLEKKILEVAAEIKRLEGETAVSLYAQDLASLDLKADLKV